MNVYSNGLAEGLLAGGFHVDHLIPTSRFERFSDSHLVMRYLRYLYYPQLLKSLDSLNVSINHITDHGYAHLYSGLREGLKIITVHDLIPILMWKKSLTGKPSRKPLLNLYSLSFLNKFDKVISVSQSTADDITNYLGIDAAKIVVIPPVLSSRFQQIDQQDLVAFRSQYGLDEQFKWLMLSGRESYKNHPIALKVFKRLVDRGHHNLRLIKTGLPSAEFNQWVVNLGLSAYVKQCYLADHQDIPKLYNSVNCLLFPSLYEGFGVPVVEALACGTPVVTSNRGSLLEVGGNLAIACDAMDIDALSDSTIKAMYNNEYISKVKSESADWVDQYRASEVVKRLISVYQNP